MSKNPFSSILNDLSDILTSGNANSSHSSNGTKTDNPKKTVKTSVIKGMLKKTESFLSFEQDDDDVNNSVAESLKAYIAEYNRIEKLKAANLKACSVISSYEQQGKIKDKLLQYEQYISRIGCDSDEEIEKLEGYGNYLSAVEIEVKKVKETYSPIDIMELLADCHSASPDGIAALLNGSFENTALSEIVNIRNISKALINKLITIKKLNSEEYNEYLKVLEFARKERWFSEEELQIFREKLEALARQRHAMEQNIEKANLIFGVISELFDDDWFSRLNYKHEDCVFKNMDVSELKVFLTDCFAPIKEKLISVC